MKLIIIEITNNLKIKSVFDLNLICITRLYLVGLLNHPQSMTHVGQAAIKQQLKGNRSIYAEKIRKYLQNHAISKERI